MKRELRELDEFLGTHSQRGTPLNANYIGRSA